MLLLALAPLYLIEILHQTTTTSHITLFALPLYLIEILHQTTTFKSLYFLGMQLYLIEILHQTTTMLFAPSPLLRCILLKFYIKPQR